MNREEVAKEGASQRATDSSGFASTSVARTDENSSHHETAESKTDRTYTKGLRRAERRGGRRDETGNTGAREI